MTYLTDHEKAAHLVLLGNRALKRNPHKALDYADHALSLAPNLKAAAQLKRGASKALGILEEVKLTPRPLLSSTPAMCVSFPPARLNRLLRS